MAVRRRIGEALSGFAEDFLPAWQQQEYLKRLERGEARQGRRDLAADLASEQGLLRSEFGTQDDVEAGLSRILDVNPGADPDTIRSALESALLSDERRVAALYRQLDVVQRPHMPHESIMALAAGVGLPREAFQQATSLPSRSLMGVLEGYPGAEVPTQLMAPLEITEEAPEMAWGGPVAEQFEALQAGGREAQQAAALFQRDIAADDLRMQFRIDAEMAEKHFPENLLREVERLKTLGPIEQDFALDRERESLRLRRENELTMLGDPDYQRLTLEAAARLAKMQAILTDRPQFFDRLDPETGDVTTTMLWRSPESGLMQFQSMTGLFPGVPWNAYQAGQVSGPLAQLLTRLTESGNLDLNSAGGVEAFTREAGEMGVPPDQAMAVVANLQNISSGGELPPVSPEVLAATEQKFYGPAVEDQQPAVSSLPIDEMQRILGGTDTSVMGTREVGPGLSGLTINLGGLGRQIFGGAAPRDLQAFLRQEGVVEWLSNQAVSDPQITHEMIQALLRTPEGLEFLKNAWDTR